METKNPFRDRRTDTHSQECKRAVCRFGIARLSTADQAEEYFTLMDKAEQTPSDELRIKMYAPILARSNISSRSDYEYLKSVIANTEQKAAPIKENFEKCSRLYDLYSEIAKTYYEISRGDYISRLAEKEQKKQEREPREQMDKKIRRY